jgi:hypothetical protein
MNQWTCTVEAVNAAYTGDVQDLSERLLTRIATRTKSVAFGDQRIAATFTIEARLVLQATETAQRVWNKALDNELAWSIVAVSTRRVGEPDDLPGVPEVLGVAEVAKRLDVSKQRVVELARTHKSFPPPLTELASGPVWTAWQIGAFQRSWARKPGRPSGPAAPDGRVADRESRA